MIDNETHRAALENQFGLADRIVDEATLANSVVRFRERGITLPTFAQLADPSSFDHATHVGDADPQGQDARNLWRVHWYNDLAGNPVDVPQHVVLPKALNSPTANRPAGVRARSLMPPFGPTVWSAGP